MIPFVLVWETKCHFFWFGTNCQNFIWPHLVWPGKIITKGHLFWFGSKFQNFIWPYLVWPEDLETKWHLFWFGTEPNKTKFDDNSKQAYML
jgi:hypothetical protein